MRFGIRARFLLAVSVLLPAVLALAFTAQQGLGDLNASVNDLYTRDVVTGQLAQAVGTKLDRLDQTAIQALAAQDPAAQRRSASAVQTVDAPAVDVALVEFINARGNRTAAEQHDAAELVSRWEAFRRVWLGDVLTVGSSSRRRQVTPVFQRAYASLAADADAVSRSEALKARRSARQAGLTHRRSLLRVYEISVATLLLALGVALWLAWTIVPRARVYSRFAGRVAAGETPPTVEVRGRDELAALGHALNRMVVDRAAIDYHAGKQTEFTETIQLAESEAEAHELLKLHVERCVSGSSAVVLNRNNSEDRLEPKTRSRRTRRWPTRSPAPALATAWRFASPAPTTGAPAKCPSSTARSADTFPARPCVSRCLSEAR